MVRILPGLKSTELAYYGRVTGISMGDTGGGLMVFALNSGSSGLGSSKGQGYFVMFLGKTLSN